MKKLHLNLHGSVKYPIEICESQYKKNDVKIKVDQMNDGGTVKLLTFSETAYTSGLQQEHGFLFNTNEYYTFEATGENFIFAVKLFLEEVCIGHAVLTDALLTEDYGVIKVCVVSSTDTLKPIGYVTFDYLFLELLPENEDEQQYPVPSGFVYMGHRGSGKTLDRTADVLENTIKSFEKAHKQGASFVELDIQLTKDLVPVIFHDDFVATFAVDKNGKQKMRPVPVKDLTLEEVKTLKLDFSRDGSGSNYDGRYFELFPTLKELLESKVSTDLGLFLEVKYTEPDQGIVGLMNKKVMVEKIISVVEETGTHVHGIMFCSFDPEICLLLKHMQRSYPVFFITCGENAYTTTNPSAPYDIRTRTRKIAANFAKIHDLKGISINCDPLMNSKQEYMALTKTLQDEGKYVYSWGSANCNGEYAKVQRSIGMAGVISDKLTNLTGQ